MKILRISCTFGGFLSLVLSLSAQTFTTVLSFDNADGAAPSAPLVQATNGDLYGTTTSGGANGDGTVFKITSRGKLTTLHNFDGTDGENPQAALVQSTNGDLYGTAYGGGDNGYGTVFKIAPSGKLTTLHSFDGTDGANPAAGLVQSTNGDLYGTAYGGGANGYGTVFKITSRGKLTTLYSFCPQGGKCADGSNPVAALIRAANGNFYGTTVYGAKGGGTLFKITSGGTLTTLYRFCSKRNCTDGAGSAGALIQATDGNFYGTTLGGGSYDGGTVFKVTSKGNRMTLYSLRRQLHGRLLPPRHTGPRHEWELLRDNESWWVWRLWGQSWPPLRHGLQPVWGSGAICGNPADLRQGRVGRQGFGNGFDGCDQRHL